MNPLNDVVEPTRIKAARYIRKLSHVQAAHAVGISVHTYRKLEGGHQIANKYAEKIAEAFSVPVGFLYLGPVDLELNMSWPGTCNYDD